MFSLGLSPVLSSLRAFLRLWPELRVHRGRKLKTARGHPPRGLGGVEGRRPKTVSVVSVPVAEPAPLSLPGSAWGLRWVTGSLDPESTPRVVLTEASSALPTPRLGAWTASTGWSLPQGDPPPLAASGLGEKRGRSLALKVAAETLDTHLFSRCLPAECTLSCLSSLPFLASTPQGAPTPPPDCHTRPVVRFCFSACPPHSASSRTLVSPWGSNPGQAEWASGQGAITINEI